VLDALKRATYSLPRRTQAAFPRDTHCQHQPAASVACSRFSLEPLPMPETKSDPYANHTVEERWNEAQLLLDEIVQQALRPWKRHHRADDVNRFKQRLSEKLLRKNKKPLGDLLDEAKLKPWLQKIANREVSRVLQREGQSVRFEDAPSEILEQPPVQEELLLLKEQTQLLTEAIAKLMRRERKLVELIQQDLNAEKMAKELGIKVKSVHRMKNAVVKKLEKLINGGLIC
jgi:RNA polymerase sigma factor (sigma-70 family)